jgi:hypothetical protein
VFALSHDLTVAVSIGLVDSLTDLGLRHTRAGAAARSAGIVTRARIELA